MGAFDEVSNITVPDPSDPTAADAFRKKWNWDAHEQVLLRGAYTAGDMENVTNASILSSKKGDAVYQAGTARTKLLECMIIDWTLTRNGQKMPISAHSIKRLPANYMTPLLERCDELAKTMTEEEQEDFLDAANAPSLVSSELANLSLTLS